MRQSTLEGLPPFSLVSITSPSQDLVFTKPHLTPVITVGGNLTKS